MLRFIIISGHVSFAEDPQEDAVDAYYATDSAVTSLVQRISRSLSGIRFVYTAQCVFLVITCMAYFVAGLSLMPIDLPHVLAVLALFLAWVMLVFYVGPYLLLWLHLRVDPEGAGNTQKELSDGYQAWAAVLMMAIATLGILLLRTTDYVGIIFFFLMGSKAIAYMSFVERVSYPRRKRRKRKRTEVTSGIFGRLQPEWASIK